MNEEQSAQLSEELLAAQDEAGRTRVLIRWLPVLVRCQIKTAARAKQLLADTNRIETKMDTLHSAPRFKTDPIGWLKANWQWLIIFLLLLKQNGLADLLKELFALTH